MTVGPVFPPRSIQSETAGPIRNLIRAGVDRTVAKPISGHRTGSVFKRYNITTDDDPAAAAERVETYLEGRKKIPPGPNRDF